MPLSEQEQRLLDEMERHLYRNDADFVSTTGDRRGRPSYRSIAIGCLIALVGVAALVTGVIIQQPIVGVIGFVVMLGGVLVAISPSKRSAKPADLGAMGGKPAKGRKSGGSFMDRMNTRWERRQDGEH
ncbi:Protein of unknown function [Paramicrobacterium humi]|uniref:DUF3040 domain-containing protein n=1 Tax=Paramicrobacterium humi TaxID=640635 RepID=A0A1H4TVA7_9MICO|nr:DUF3040 domain-containing protein [Microbacterium humi]SEC60395.1 Protein of unknown function [Microbacterium humi]